MNPKIIVNQRIVIARLGEYCNYTPRIARYYQDNQASFMRERLGAMAKPIMDLKQDILSDACSKFIGALKSIEGVWNRTRDDFSRVFDEFSKAYEDLSHILDRFVCHKDFEEIKEMMPSLRARRLGDKVLLRRSKKRFEHDRLQVLRDNLSRLKPMSLLEEERKKEGQRDHEAERLISYTYNRLGLAAHEKKFRESLKEWLKTHQDKTPKEKEKALDSVLNRFWENALPNIREDVRNYCCQFQIPANENGDGALTPFMLPKVEALMPTNERLFNKVRLIHQSLKPG